MPHDTPTQTDSKKWFELFELARRCPAKVPNLDGSGNIAITGATRLTLWTLVHHVNGSSLKTWILEETIQEEIRADRKTVDRAVSALKRSGLVSTTQIIRADGTFSGNMWTLNRARLEALVGEKQEDAVLQQVVDVVKVDGECCFRTSAARIQETRSRLYHLAKDFRITIEGEAFEGIPVVTLTIRAAEPEKNQKKEISLESVGPGIVAAAIAEPEPVAVAARETPTHLAVTEPIPVVAPTEPEVDPLNTECRKLIENFLDRLRVSPHRTNVDYRVRDLRKLIDGGTGLELLGDLLNFYANDETNRRVWPVRDDCPVVSFIMYYQSYLVKYQKSFEKQEAVAS